MEMISLKEFNSKEWLEKYDVMINRNHTIPCTDKSCKKYANFKIVHLGMEEMFYCLTHTGKYQGMLNAIGYPLAIVYEITMIDEHGWEYQEYLNCLSISSREMMVSSLIKMA